MGGKVGGLEVEGGAMAGGEEGEEVEWRRLRMLYVYWNTYCHLSCAGILSGEMWYPR